MYDLPVATVAGIAPRAHVIAYKGLGEQGGFTSDLAAAIDQAVADGVDVINYSVGGGAGLPAADEIAFLFAAEAGVFVATSAGNDGPDAETLGSPATMPWVTSVGASTQRRFFEGWVMLGNGKRYRGASLTPEIGPDAARRRGVRRQRRLRARQARPGDRHRQDRAVHPRRGRPDREEPGRIRGRWRRHDPRTTRTTSTTSSPTAIGCRRSTSTTPRAWRSRRTSPRATSPTARFETRTNAGEPRVTQLAQRADDDRRSRRAGPNPVAPDLIKPDVTAPGLQILAGNSPVPRRGRRAGRAVPGDRRHVDVEPARGRHLRAPQAGPPGVVGGDGEVGAHDDRPRRRVRDNDRRHRADPFDMGAGHVRPGGRWGKGSDHPAGSRL